MTLMKIGFVETVSSPTSPIPDLAIFIPSGVLAHLSASWCWSSNLSCSPYGIEAVHIKRMRFNSGE